MYGNHSIYPKIRPSERRALTYFLMRLGRSRSCKQCMKHWPCVYACGRCYTCRASIQYNRSHTYWTSKCLYAQVSTWGFRRNTLVMDQCVYASFFGPAASTKGTRKPKTNSGDGKNELRETGRKRIPLRHHRKIVGGSRAGVRGCEFAASATP
jgi:hypothetical protein